VASAITHGLIGGAIGVIATIGWRAPARPGDDLEQALQFARHDEMLRRFSLLVAGFSMLPDVDTLMHTWVAYSHPFGHRGAFHSVAFYLVLCGAIAWLPAFSGSRGRAFVALFAALLSHSLLDMLTNGGLGIALLWPLSSERWFFPWRPIPVSPLTFSAFFSARGLRILSHELPFAVPILVVAGVLRWAWCRKPTPR